MVGIEVLPFVSCTRLKMVARCRNTVLSEHVAYFAMLWLDGAGDEGPAQHVSTSGVAQQHNAAAIFSAWPGRGCRMLNTSVLVVHSGPFSQATSLCNNGRKKS